MSRPESIPAMRFARLVQGQQLGHRVAEGLVTVVGGAEGDLGLGVLQYASGDRVPLGMVRIQKTFWRSPPDHLGQFPPQVHGILDARVEALAAVRGDVCVRRPRRASTGRGGKSPPVGSCP